MKDKTAQPDRRSLPDAEILALVASWSELFEELVVRYQRAFLRKAVSILGDEADAEDAVQETFVRIYVSASRFRAQEGATFSSWAYRILVNQCYTAYSKKHRVVAISLEADPDLGECIPDQAAINEIESRFTTDYVMRMLSRLPVILRRVVEQYFIEGRPQKEIAADEGVSGGVIRQRIHRAKRELRKLDLKLAYIPSDRSANPSNKLLK